MKERCGGRGRGWEIRKTITLYELFLFTQRGGGARFFAFANRVGRIGLSVRGGKFTVIVERQNPTHTRTSTIAYGTPMRHIIAQKKNLAPHGGTQGAISDFRLGAFINSAPKRFSAKQQQWNNFSTVFTFWLETSKLDRWIAFDPLYTLSLTSFLSLYK